MIVIKIVVCQNIKDIWLSLYSISIHYSLSIVAFKKKLEFESVYMYIFLINIYFIFRIFFVRGDRLYDKIQLFFCFKPLN